MPAPVTQPERIRPMPSDSTPHIAIIGGGFAGAVTALKLARAAPRPLAITIVESRPELGRGIAYSTRNPAHLMNGPAKNFTLYPDQPEHLAYWLRNQAERDGWRPPAGVAYADSFAPRHLYGDYVQAELENALAQAPHPIAFKHLAGRARDLDGDGAARWAVRLEDGRQLRADYVVLATGLFPRTLHETGLELDPELVRRGAVIDDLWSEPPPKALARDRDVLVIGSNLSALDAMIHADSHGFRGEFHSVSRRGLLVAPRRDVQPWPSFLDPQALPATLRDLLRAVQAARRDIASAGEDWQRLAGAVRPHLPALWTAASADERLRFIRHLRPYWELGLHRAAPESNAWLQDARRAGRFRHHAGRVLRLSSAAGGRVAVSWRARGESRPQTLLVDRVFNTRGFEFDWTRIDDALLRNLLGKGLAVPHETGFGIAADPATGEVAQRHGQRPGLYAVGHPVRGVSWESNAIGEQIAGATATVTALAEQLRSAAETGFFPSAGTGLGRQAVRAA